MKITGLTKDQVDNRVETLSAAMRAEMKNVCALASEHVVSFSSAITADGDLSTAIDAIGVIPEQWQKGVVATILPYIEGVFNEAAAKVAAPLGDVTPTKATNFIADMDNMITGFSSDLWDTAKATLIAGTQDGESVKELATRVEAVADVKVKKAHVIAQTTIIAAINGGEWQQMMESASAFDMVMTKEWVSTHDTHTRPSHEIADGQTVPLSEKFVVGDSLLDFPGDPNGDPSEIISCRCTTVYDAEIDEPITASQTSRETLLTDSAAVLYGPFDDGLVAAFNEKDHPRGKDGKFIKSSVVGGFVKDILAGKWSSGDLTTSEKKVFVKDISSLKAEDWNNFKPEQKAKITKALEDTVEEGVPGSAKATMHLEDIDDGDDSDVNVPDVFNPSTPLPEPDTSTPPHLVGYTEAATKAKKDLDEYVQDGALTDYEAEDFQKKLWNAKSTAQVQTTHAAMTAIADIWYNDNVEDRVDQSEEYDALIGKINIAKAKGLISSDEANEIKYDLDNGDATLAFSEQKLNDLTIAHLNTAPLTTGSSTPVKITHGLIHAKHAPGTVIAQTDTGGVGIRIKWNGSEYELESKGQHGDWQSYKTIKKSKLYAEIAAGFNENAKWSTPGKQQTNISHVTPQSAAPPAAHIPHPVATPSPGPVNSPFQILTDTGDNGDGYAAPGLWGKYGAAGVMIKNTDENGVERFLMVQRGPMVSSNKGKWQLAGGALNSKESPEQGAAREIFEEIGAPQEYLASMEHKGTHDVAVPIPGKDAWVYSNIAAEAPTMFAPKIDGTETGDAKWLTKEEIQQLVDDGKMHPAVTKALPSVFALYDTSGNNEPAPSPAVAPSVPVPTSVISSPSTPSVAQKVDLTGWKKVGGQIGSNKGALYEDTAGKQYYVKSLKSADHVKSEVLAAALYNAAGIDVPEVRRGTNHPDGWKNVIISPIVLNAKSAKTKLQTGSALSADVQSGYAVDAWLANHDVVGLGFDNIIESDGKPWRIDMGGSLEYRAQGGKKNGWGSDPTTELNGLKDSSVNAQSAKVFGVMNAVEEKESAKKLLPLTDEKIDQLVKDAGMPSSLGDTLKARRKFILDKYGLDGQNSSTPSVTPAIVDTTPPVDLGPGPSVAAPSPGTFDTDSLATSMIDISHLPPGAGGVIANGVSAKHPNAKYAYAFGDDDTAKFMYQTLGQPWKQTTQANASKLGINWTLTTDAESIDVSGTTTTSVSAPSVNAPSVPVTGAPPSVPIVSAADISPAVKYTFYQHFKAEKVSPAWSAAKIYASMHVAKAKMSGDPKIAALSDGEMLKILDTQHWLKNPTSATPPPVYSAKVKDWLKTPNGQKAFKELNPAIATTSMPTTGYTPWVPNPSPLVKKTAAKKGFAKKAAVKKAASLVTGPKKTQSEILAHAPNGQTPSINAIESDLIYSAVKAKPQGNSVKSPPVELFKSVFEVAGEKGASVDQVLQAMDTETAKKYSSVTHTYKATISDWLNTPSGSKNANAIIDGTYVPPVKKVAAPSATYGSTPNYGTGSSFGSSSSYTHAKDLPLDQKITNLTQQIEKFDPAKAYNPKNKHSGPPENDFPVVSADKAKVLWAKWQKDQGAMNGVQKTALKSYTGSGFSSMNSYLRGYEGASDALHKKVNDAQAGMKLSTEPMVFHRGNGWFTGWKSVADVKSKVGTDFPQEAFFSTSIGGKSAFGGPINFIIEAPPGTPMAYVKGFSSFSSENEMLMGANITYKVISVHETDIDGSWHYGTKVTVVLRAIPHEDVTV